MTMMPRPASSSAMLPGSGTTVASTARRASIRLSTVGQTGVATCTAEIARLSRVFDDTNPRNEPTWAFTMVCDTAPLRSVAVSKIEPARKAPVISESKKLPPMACTPPVKLEKVMVSVAVFVESHGLEGVPAPKNDVVETVPV